MDVGGKRPADRQPVGAGLLLRDAPLAGPAGLRARAGNRSSAGHMMPASTSTMPLCAIEGTDAIEFRHVEHHRVARKLLGTHGMPAAGDADGTARHAAARLIARCRARVESTGTISCTRVGFS